MGEEYCYGLLGWCAGEGASDVVSPELISHGAYGWGTDCIWYACDFEVESADGEVGLSGLGVDEGEEGVGGCVVFSWERLLVGSGGLWYNGDSLTVAIQSNSIVQLALLILMHPLGPACCSLCWNRVLPIASVEDKYDAYIYHVVDYVQSAWRR